MTQPQTDGIMQMLDPFGFWKTSRDTMLEAWSKQMIDLVNSQEYAQFTGTFLDQYMGLAQPVQDAVQKSMTMALPFWNLPSRDEVISLATQLVNIETRLDDLDALANDIYDSDRTETRSVERRMDKVEEKIGSGDESVAKELRSVDRSLDKVLTTILARLDDLEAAIVPAREKADAKAEAKPQAK